MAKAIKKAAPVRRAAAREEAPDTGVILWDDLGRICAAEYRAQWNDPQCDNDKHKAAIIDGVMKVWASGKTDSDHEKEEARQHITDVLDQVDEELS